MKNIIENRYDKTTDVPDNLPEGVIIDDNEYPYNESIVEIDLKGLTPAKENSLCSMTIIEELESIKSSRDSSVNTDSLIDIERLTMQIDGLTSVRRSKKKKGPGIPATKDKISSRPVEAGEEIPFFIEKNKLEEIEGLINENEIQDIHTAPKSSGSIRGEYKEHAEETGKAHLEYKEQAVKDIEDIIENKYALFEDESGDTAGKDSAIEKETGVKLPSVDEKYHSEEISGLDSMQHEGFEIKDVIEDHYSFMEEDAGDMSGKGYTIEPEKSESAKEEEEKVKSRAEEVGLDKQVQAGPPDHEEAIEDYAFLEEETAEIPEKKHSTKIETKAELPSAEEPDKAEEPRVHPYEQAHLEPDINAFIEDQQESLEKKEDILTIEIPEKLRELPPEFNIDELGKIDLNEAETIAEEDILSFTGGEILQELKELDILPEHEPEVQKQGPAAPEKNSRKEKAEKIIKETGGDIEAKTEQKETAGRQEKAVTVETDDIPSKPVEKPEDSDEKSANEVKAIEEIIPDITPGTVYPEESSNENVLIIDNENLNITDPDAYAGADELESITSGMKDNLSGKAKQLAESDNADRKSVTGLIRDNYPTFTDLLKEKEPEERRNYADDDIVFVDDLFIKEKPKKPSRGKVPGYETARETTISLNERILGLIPDELRIIEHELFNINLNKPSIDLISAGKYKYILPDPDSLLARERKSIEDDISSESALILEEDVDKIKKKLEDSMKKKIEETIQDITDKITIYEDNKNNSKTGGAAKDKEEIKKLLEYLDELLEKLPEDAIKNFADSEYYELYKKVLKNMDK